MVVNVNKEDAKRQCRFLWPDAKQPQGERTKNILGQGKATNIPRRYISPRELGDRAAARWISHGDDGAVRCLRLRREQEVAQRQREQTARQQQGRSRR